MEVYCKLLNDPCYHKTHVLCEYNIKYGIKAMNVSDHKYLFMVCMTALGSFGSFIFYRTSFAVIKMSYVSKEDHVLRGIPF